MIFPIPDIRLRLFDRALVIDSARPLKTLSSAVVGGGYQEVHHIINLHVHKNYSNGHPADDIHAFARDSKLTQPYLGLMTAVFVEEYKLASSSRGGLTAAVVITAGLGNAVSAGLSPPSDSHPSPGTINTIIIMDGNLSPSAMANALMTATEAKTSVLFHQNLTTREGYPATGTSTDAVVVACTGRGEVLPYAGPSTTPGWLISNTVRTALWEAIS